MDSLRGKVALVTGGAQGLGQASAERLGAAGCKVVIADLQEEKAEAVCGAIAAAGGEASALAVDVTSSEAVAAMVGAVLERHGRLDCAVNNAGSEGVIAPTDRYPEERWHQVIAINLTGVFLCMRQELAAMREQGSGAIVNMASICGVTGLADFSAYNASKHGVVGFMRSLALEVAPHRIRVNTVHPTSVSTPMILNDVFPRLVRPDVEDPTEEHAAEFLVTQQALEVPWVTPGDVSDAVLWLCSDEARYVTGATLPVDAGALLK